MEGGRVEQQVPLLVAEVGQGGAAATGDIFLYQVPAPNACLDVQAQVQAQVTMEAQCENLVRSRRSSMRWPVQRRSKRWPVWGLCFVSFLVEGTCRRGVSRLGGQGDLERRMQKM